MGVTREVQEPADQNADAAAGCEIPESTIDPSYVLRLMLTLIGEKTEDEDSSSDDQMKLDDEAPDDPEQKKINACCILWDLCMSHEYVTFLCAHQILRIIHRIISVPSDHSNRFLEVCIGILGNIATFEEMAPQIGEDPQLVEDILSLFHQTADPPILVEICRLFTSCLAFKDSRSFWKEIFRSLEQLERTLWVFENALNGELSEKVAWLLVNLVFYGDDADSHDDHDGQTHAVTRSSSTGDDKDGSGHAEHPPNGHNVPDDQNSPSGHNVSNGQDAPSGQNVLTPSNGLDGGSVTVDTAQSGDGAPQPDIFRSLLELRLAPITISVLQSNIQPLNVQMVDPVLRILDNIASSPRGLAAIRQASPADSFEAAGPSHSFSPSSLRGCLLRFIKDQSVDAPELCVTAAVILRNLDMPPPPDDSQQSLPHTFGRLLAEDGELLGALLDVLPQADSTSLGPLWSSLHAATHHLVRPSSSLGTLVLRANDLVTGALIGSAEPPTECSLHLYSAMDRLHRMLSSFKPSLSGQEISALATLSRFLVST